ncbi:MAG: hypothetical protein ABJO01_01410 [Parasphingorhabdus sp.]|uniref:hypothetical protein n=1 Tax=Parasphingorhabdus sp. TaxID=2709688 RepID=UPI00329A32B0
MEINPLIIPILGISCGVLAVIGGVFVKPWIKFKQEQLKVQTEMTAEKAAQYAAHTELLEKRVRVLERIVTDKGADLAGQIEDLRDEPQKKELN